MSDVVYIEIIEEVTAFDVINEVVQVIELGIQGPPGPQGPSGPSGGEEDVPTAPTVDPKSSTDLATGSEVNLDSTLIPNAKTAKLSQITLSSSVACKWEIKKSSGGTDTTMDVVFTSGNTGNSPSHEWEPPHRDYATLAGNGSTTFYRVVATNLDNAFAANVYATYFYDKVDTE